MEKKLTEFIKNDVGSCRYRLVTKKKKGPSKSASEFKGHAERKGIDLMKTFCDEGISGGLESGS